MRFSQAQIKFKQLKEEKKAEEEVFNNIKAVRSLYGWAHILKMEVIKHVDDPEARTLFEKVAKTREEVKERTMMSEKLPEKQVKKFSDAFSFDSETLRRKRKERRRNNIVRMFC